MRRRAPSCATRSTARRPTRDAGVWLAPVGVPAGYTVKARAKGYEIWSAAMEPTLTRLLSR